MPSMRTVRRGASIERALTAKSCRQAEAELVRERQELASRVWPFGPDLEESILRRPVAVPDAEPPRALDERGGLRDAIARRRLGHQLEHAGHRALHDEALGYQVEGQAEGLRLVDDGDDALGDGGEIRNRQQLEAHLLLEHVARDDRERLGDRRVGLAQVVDELAVLLPDLPVRLLVALEGRPDDVGQHAAALVEKEMAQRREPAGEILVEPAD